MFSDPEVSLVMPVSGGTGAGHLVDLLDYELIRAHPRLFTGFSNPSVSRHARTPDTARAYDVLTLAAK